MKLIVSILFIVFTFVNISRADFTVSADVTNGAVFKANISRVTEYFKDISVFQRNFPGIISVKKLGDKESEWVYEIDAPLASPVRMPFILVETISADDYMVFESKTKTPDFFRCSTRMVQLGEEETRISITIKLKMVRESGSDVHFMAPILGEKFISKEMKKDLANALSTFLSKCRKEI
jgi:hypothetical protein